MYEIRFHGRGGQGAVMAAQSLAAAAFREGYYALAFPHFGAERRGAPVLAFARIAEGKIYEKTRVYHPNYVVVLDPVLPELVNIQDGLVEGGMVIMNSPHKPEEVQLEKGTDAATVDATTIALETLGSPITNSAILGAFAKATGILKIESVEQGIIDIFGPRIGMDKAEKNARAAVAAYERTTVGTCRGGRSYDAAKMWLPDINELPVGMSTPKTQTDVGLVGIGSFLENKTGSWRTFIPNVDPDKCINCQMCWFYCPDAAVNRGEEVISFNLDYCKGCGICAEVCPVKAIEMRR